MENTEYYNKHYITVDEQGRITDLWSDGPHPDKDTTGAICINEQGEYQARLLVHDAGMGAEVLTGDNPSLYTMNGIPLYKYVGGHVLDRTEEEIAADQAAIPAPPPTAQERMEAQVTYTAMMTDTLLEEG